MSKKNNSFFVYSEIAYIIVFLLILGIGLFSFFAVNALLEDIGLTVCLAFMLILMPLLLFAWVVIFMLQRLVLTEEGITRTWFGFVIRFYKWEEIKYIYFKGKYQWIFLSTRDLSDKSITRNRISKGVLYFFPTGKKMRILAQYIPENLKEMAQL